MLDKYLRIKQARERFDLLRVGSPEWFEEGGWVKILDRADREHPIRQIKWLGDGMIHTFYLTDKLQDIWVN